MAKIKEDNRQAVSRDYVAALLQLAESHSVSQKQMLKGSGISEQQLNQPDTFMTVSQYRSVFNNGLKALKDPALGLRFGQQQHIAVHGALGYAIISSSNLKQAAQLVCKYIKIRNRLLNLKFTRKDQWVIFQMDIALAQDRLYRFMVEQAFSSYTLVLQSLLGKLKVSAFFDYPEPEYSDIYHSIFKQEVTFNAGYNQIRFLHEFTQRPIVMGNPALVKIAEKQCETLLAQLNEDIDLPGRIHDLLMKVPGMFPSQEEVARQFKLSGRTLVRRLKKYGISYQDILKNVRHELAVHYLTSTSWTVEDIAGLLGYESASNFGRAFKKWTGKSPGTYRRSKP